MATSSPVRVTVPETVTLSPVTDCAHGYDWLVVQADATDQLRTYLTCSCDRGPKLGNFGRSTPTLAGRRITAVPTRGAAALAARNNCEITGPWAVVDERTKRAAVHWTGADSPSESVTHSAVAVIPVEAEPTGSACVVDAEAFAALLAEQRAAWEAERRVKPRHGETAAEACGEFGVLPIAGPGIIGPGSHIEYRPGHRPGRYNRLPYGGVVVSIGTKAVKWRPYGQEHHVRTPLHRMRVSPTTADVTATPQGCANWWTWSLADHLAYRRPSAAPAAAAPATRPAKASTGRGPRQLPLWPDPTGAEPAAAAGVVRLRAGRADIVTGPAVTQTPATAGPLVIVPCSAAKLDRPAPAGELYRGSLHTMCRRAADTLTATGGTVLVLSALHGFLTLDQVVEPYDQRIGRPGSITAAELREQAHRIGIAAARDVTVLAGGDYAAAVRAVWPQARNPLAGSRGIGEMRHRLAQLARPTPADAEAA